MPVLAINKTRKSDTRVVNVEVLPESDKITTGELVVKLSSRSRSARRSRLARSVQGSTSARLSSLTSLSWYSTKSRPTSGTGTRAVHAA